MGITRQYQTYYGYYLNHWQETWGTNYNTLLDKNYPDPDASAKDTSDASNPITFLYPLLVKNQYYIDGRAEGVFTLWNRGAGGTTITEFTITLLKIDIAGTPTDLKSEQVTLSSNNVIASKGYLSFQFYLNVVKQKVKANEKLALKISITGGDDLCWSHANDSAEKDVWIKIPYVPQTGG